MERIQKVNPSCDILHEVVRDMHDVQTKKQQGFSALTGALMAVAIQAVMPGFGSSVLATMRHAATIF